jgi:signal transduction histidine kinase
VRNVSGQPNVNSAVAVLRAADSTPAPRAIAAGRHAWTAVEQERRRWARELHDETLQNLAGLLIRLSSARRGGRQELIAAAVDETISGLQQEITNLRSMITDLRPAALDELGIEVAITALAQRAARNGLAVELDVGLSGGDSAARFDLDTAVYRIVQEALTNAQKHGGATRAFVDVQEDEELIEIIVRDDGDGFDPRAHTSGLGLLGMRERVELLGGGLSIHSRPGSGTTIRATLPAAAHLPARDSTDQAA